MEFRIGQGKLHGMEIAFKFDNLCGHLTPVEGSATGLQRDLPLASVISYSIPWRFALCEPAWVEMELDG